jgi:tetratricopeptide (TPR) repeat protein
MLFDLRGRGRRNTVRVIYASLAILMGGGLVLFGVGGSGGGLFSNAGNGSTQSVSDITKKRLAKAEAGVKARPKDPTAWAALTRARFQSISNTEITTGGQYVGGGVTKAKSARDAWNRYLALNPAKPDVNLATLMRQVLLGLGQVEQAVAAQEIVVDATKPPTYQSYQQLAFLAYAAGQTRKADLSSQKALQLAPKDQRNTLKSQLDQAKAQAAQQAAQQAATTPTPAPTTTTTTP